MKLNSIDKGKEFDFGKTSPDYAKFRDIYPENMYKMLISFGIGKPGQNILDLGSGTAVLPINMSGTGARFTAADISENQILFGKQLAEEKGFKNIDFKVCSADDTGFRDDSFDVVTAVQCFHYFNADKAADEIRRVLNPGGLFCKIFMDWLPYEDEIIGEMESMVLKYNPDWSGAGFKEFKYTFPDWAKGKFEVQKVHSYDAVLEFTKEQWIGRIKSCRGIGASLPENEIEKFESEYRETLAKYNEPLNLKHQIHIEIYRSTKTE